MQLDSFIADVLAGTISGAAVAALPLLARNRIGDVPTAPMDLQVHGIGNTVRTDLSKTTTISFVDARNAPTTRLAHHSEPTSSADPADVMALICVGTVVALLAFVLVWPVALGFLFGSALATAGVLLGAAASTPSGWDLPRRCALIQGVVCCATTAGICALILSSTADGRGLRGIERQLGAELPGFKGSVSGRWNAVTERSGDVLLIIGLEGATMLLLQFGALALGAMCTALLAARAAGWLALLDLHADGHPRGWKLRLANRFMRGARGDLVVTVVACVLALPLASGLAFEFFKSTAPDTHSPRPQVVQPTGDREH